MKTCPAVFLVGLLVLLLAACQPIVPAGSEISITPERVAYEATYAEVECPFVVPYSVDITCGTLTVPENRGRADSRMIKVFVQTIHALSDQPQLDPIVVLPGGPGDDASHARNLFYRLPARADRDIILVDPRGTGYSDPNLNCMENGGIGFVYDSAVGAAKDCYDRLKSSGIDLSGYTTAEQVADVADLA